MHFNIISDFVDWINPLYEDQIHVPAFLKYCTHIWSDDVSRSEKSGVWDYYVSISKEFNKPLVDYSNFPERGIIFVGMCHILEDIFNAIPKNGNYIFVHRTNDRPYTKQINNCKPFSVKYVYTVDCRGNFNNVSAIPFGNASINGEDNLVKIIIKEKKRPTDKRIFVCYNTNHDTQHRNESIVALKDKPFAFVYELDYPHKQMPADNYARNIHDHEFTMALAGCGADASRQWVAIQLGSIPIVSDCPEMRHFEDLPLVFCPQNFDDITDNWLNEKAKEVKGKSIERMRASYWINHINEKRKEYGI